LVVVYSGVLLDGIALHILEEVDGIAQRTDRVGPLLLPAGLAIVDKGVERDETVGVGVLGTPRPSLVVEVVPAEVILRTCRRVRRTWCNDDGSGRRQGESRQGAAQA